MDDHPFIDPLFDRTNSSHYDLSIQISLDGFCFCIVDPSDSAIKVYRHYALNPVLSISAWEDQIENLIKNDEWFTLSWQTVRILWGTEKSVIIPASLFIPEKAKGYLEYHHWLGEYDEVHFHKLFFPASFVIFPVPGDITHLISKYIPNAHYFHAWVPLSLNVAKANGTNSLYLTLHHKFAEFFVHQNGKPSNLCHFSWQEPYDILYFILKTGKDFHFDFTSSPLIVYGYPGSKESIQPMLTEYIKQWQEGKILYDNIPAPLLNIPPLQRPVHLLNLHQCGL